jgi:poly-beta-1,6-N-acetyl-D-glucosamine synthase
MLFIFSCFIFFLTLIYCFAVFKLWQGWNSIPYFRGKDIEVTTFVSVIVPIRNEEQNISNLLSDLLKQELSFHQFEVIIIDDYSEDSSFEVVTNFKTQYPHLDLKIFRAEAQVHLSNKKRSITKAIGLAKGTLIVCTDGDCRVGEKWLNTLAQFYEQEKCYFMSAPVTFDSPQNFFEKMQVVEFSSLIISGAAMLSYGYPTMANGANIAYTKQIFEEVKGFEGNLHINTGDDEFLMQKIFAQYPSHIRFLKSKEAIVRTYPLASLSYFYNQRIRWASKWKQHQAKQVSWVALCVFMYHLLNLFAFVILFGIFVSANLYQIIILAHFLLKFCFEFVLLASILDFVGNKKYYIYILPLQLIYSFYVVVIGILSNFGSYHWKGRTVNKS